MLAAQIEMVARYGAAPKEVAGVWVDSLLPAQPTSINIEIPLGIQIYWQMK
jgi:hypothetical protein